MRRIPKIQLRCWSQFRSTFEVNKKVIRKEIDDVKGNLYSFSLKLVSQVIFSKKKVYSVLRLKNLFDLRYRILIGFHRFPLTKKFLNTNL